MITQNFTYILSATVASIIPLIIKVWFDIPRKIQNIESVVVDQKQVKTMIEEHCSNCSLKQTVSFNKSFTDKNSEELITIRKEMQEMNLKLAETCVYLRDILERR